MSETAIQLTVGLVIALGAVAVVLLPSMRRERAGAPADRDALEQRIGRYRTALDAGTVCERCLFPNPPGSAYCAGCGRKVGGA